MPNTILVECVFVELELQSTPHIRIPSGQHMDILICGVFLYEELANSHDKVPNSFDQRDNVSNIRLSDDTGQLAFLFTENSSWI